jgi:HEAT repeat protein/MFS family permease
LRRGEADGAGGHDKLSEAEARFRGLVREGEERFLVLASTLAFCVLAVSVLCLGCVTALFLGARPRADLPWAYGAAAVFGVVASALVAWASERVARVKEALAIIVMFAITLALCWALLDSLPSSFLFVVYPLCTGMAALTLVQAFAIVSDCIDADQAKRLYPLIGAGGTLGAVAAGGAMAVLAPRLGVRSLLLIAAVLLGMVALLAQRLVHQHVAETAASLRPPSKPTRARVPALRALENSVALIVDDKLVRLFALAQVALMVASTLLKYQFETTLQQTMTMERITVFLGLFNLAANAFVLAVQMLAEGKLLKRFGLGFGLMSVPSVFALLLPLLLFTPAVWAVAAVRLGEHVARFSVARTADDLVLLPLSSAKRRRARTLVTGALSPMAVMGTSLLIVALGTESERLRVSLAWAAGALAVLLVTAMKKPYLERLRGSLAGARVALVSTGFAISSVTSRAGMREAIDLALGSPDPKRLLFGLGMAAETNTPIELERLEPLYLHSDGRVREAAFVTAQRIGNEDFIPALSAAFFEERDAHARIACARALCRHMPEERLDELSPLLDDESPSIRAEALARRYAARREDTEMFTRLSQGNDTDREGVARALSAVAVPTHAQGSLLGGLLRDSSLEVRKAALRAAARSYEPLHLPHVIAALDQRPLGRQAADVLQAWPVSVSVPALESAAREATTRQRRRLSIAALGRVTHPDAIGSLLRFVTDVSDDMRQATLQALNRQRARGADLASGRDIILAAAKAELGRARWAELCATRLSREKGLPPARVSTAVKELHFVTARAEERLFLWLSLVYPREEMLRSQRSLVGTDRQARAFATEMLDQMLEPSLRNDIVPWVRGSKGERTVLAERSLSLERRSGAAVALAATNERTGRWLALYLGLASPQDHPETPTMSVLETIFVLRTVELFSQLSGEELRAVAELAETTRFEAGNVIVVEGAPGDALFILLRGEVEVSRAGASLATLRDGECFGELALLDRGTRSATVTARTDCETAKIRAEDFHDLLDEVPSIARAMLAILARRTQNLLDRKPA